MFEKIWQFPLSMHTTGLMVLGFGGLEFKNCKIGRWGWGFIPHIGAINVMFQLMFWSF